MAKRQSGFTLIEILIVVIILGILAAIVIPQFTSASNDAKVSAMQSTVQSVQGQIELYKLQHNDTAPGTDVLGTLATAVYDTVALKTYGPYLPTQPINPFTNSTAVSATQVGSGWAYSGGRFFGVYQGTWFPK